MSLLLICLGLPLIWRRVPRNRLYGFRMFLSYKSDQNWYDINEAGGKILAGWCLILLMYGIMGLVTEQDFIAYAIGSALVSFVMIAGMVVHTYIVARRIDRHNNGG